MRLLRCASLALFLLPATLVACGDDGNNNTAVDAGNPGIDATINVGLCETYCTAVTAQCSGDNAQYINMSDCMDYCGSAGWPDGMTGDTTGNTLECRIYHAGDPATAEPAEHCPHAGATGGGLCGATVTFRNDADNAYTRVDRIGMPAVSTVLVSSGMKAAYNDANPSDDAAGTFADDLILSLTGLHTALDDDFTGLNLAPCSMTTMVNGLPECLGQEIATGVTVASLVLPDTLRIDPSAAAGFPNGRMLADQVIDVTLAIIFLKMGATCDGGLCTPATLASPPLNPAANDVAFDTNFPYLAVPHQP